jgi:hypothetical protein
LQHSFFRPLDDDAIVEIGKQAKGVYRRQSFVVDSRQSTVDSHEVLTVDR